MQKQWDLFQKMSEQVNIKAILSQSYSIANCKSKKMHLHWHEITSMILVRVFVDLWEDGAIWI